MSNLQGVAICTFLLAVLIGILGGDPANLFTWALIVAVFDVAQAVRGQST